MSSPWEQRETAVAAGLDPASLTERAARRRTGDAGLGRPILVPVYLRPLVPLSQAGPYRYGVLVRLAPGGAVRAPRAALPPGLGFQSSFWTAVYRAYDNPDALARREDWSRVLVGQRDGLSRDWSLVLRSTDLDLLRAALELSRRSADEPQDAPLERVLARFLGRLDGQDGTASAGLWGRLALEVVSLRHPDRLADTRSLRWHACWGRGGLGAGSSGRSQGSAGHEMLLDLASQRVTVEGRSFRVRTLPDWEREQAAYDLGMPPGRLMAWPVSPVPDLLAWFTDTAPAPLDPPGGPAGPQDAPRR